MAQLTHRGGRSQRLLLCAALALALASVAPAARAATNNIFTVAGTTAGLSGDGGPATAAQLNAPFGVAATADGGFLIADGVNTRIRRVSPAGTITTVAGTSTGALGDGGPATAAQLAFPAGVAVTADGGFLIPDQSNHRVRFVDADLRGPASGPAGATGLPGPAGPQGPVGPGFDRLALAFASDRFSALPRKRLTLRYAATTASTVELRVLRGRRTMARVHGRAKHGRNTIRLPALRTAGRYQLELVATTSGGQRATDKARLTVTKAAPAR